MDNEDDPLVMLARSLMEIYRLRALPPVALLSRPRFRCRECNATDYFIAITINAGQRTKETICRSCHARQLMIPPFTEPRQARLAPAQEVRAVTMRCCAHCISIQRLAEAWRCQRPNGPSGDTAEFTDHLTVCRRFKRQESDDSP